ncbi:hypothetical protein V1514DRAFT_338481 [Lipomyces japonicus]|uniref:uncharacterized protein n=1 Tax=Lipomyces japonicus TaxID=56871 RepID=UPI0034D00941
MSVTTANKRQRVVMPNSADTTFVPVIYGPVAWSAFELQCLARAVASTKFEGYIDSYQWWHGPGCRLPGLQSTHSVESYLWHMVTWNYNANYIQPAGGVLRSTSEIYVKWNACAASADIILKYEYPHNKDWFELPPLTQSTLLAGHETLSQEIYPLVNDAFVRFNRRRSKLLNSSIIDLQYMLGLKNPILAFQYWTYEKELKFDSRLKHQMKRIADHGLTSPELDRFRQSLTTIHGGNKKQQARSETESKSESESEAARGLTPLTPISNNVLNRPNRKASRFTDAIPTPSKTPIFYSKMTQMRKSYVLPGASSDVNDISCKSKPIATGATPPARYSSDTELEELGNVGSSSPARCRNDAIF